MRQVSMRNGGSESLASVVTVDPAECLTPGAASEWTHHEVSGDRPLHSTAKLRTIPVFCPSKVARAKRVSFLVVSSLYMGTLAFLSLVVARWVVAGRWPDDPYLILGLAAAGIVAAMTWRSRPDRRRAAGGWLEEWVDAATQILATTVALVVLAFFWRPWDIRYFAFSRGTILALAPIGFVILGGGRTLLRLLLFYLRRHGHNLSSVIVIGTGPSADSFIKAITEKPGSGYRLAAHVTAQPDEKLSSVLDTISAVTAIDEVIVASMTLDRRDVQTIVGHPALREARIRAVPELFGLPPSKVQVVQFGGFPLTTLFENPVRGPRWLVKRALDVIAATAGLLLTAPVLLLIGAAIKLDSPGPVIFRQERVGMDGKVFEVLKFRTMTHRAPESFHRELMTSLLAGSQATQVAADGFFKPADDPRVTRSGRFLRRTSLDEIPQLLNVLRGEMSIVGPRPALAYEVELYEEWQRRRLDVLPGVTGLWQVSGRSRLSPRDMLRLDVHYADTWSLPGDLLILLKTLPALFRDNAR